MPRFSIIGLAPAATFFKPSRTMAWARRVAVVVPSPATSLVLVATSLTSWAPMFSKGSSSSISFAMVTPSLVMSGDPNFLSNTTFLPLGPRVIFTIFASLLTPLSSAFLASSPNKMSFAMIYASFLFHYRKDVALLDNGIFFAIDLDFGSGILADENPIPFLDFHLYLISAGP